MHRFTHVISIICDKIFGLKFTQTFFLQKPYFNPIFGSLLKKFQQIQNILGVIIKYGIKSSRNFFKFLKNSIVPSQFLQHYRNL